MSLTSPANHGRGAPGSIMLIEPRPQPVWGGHAATNFVFGGSGAGLYLLGIWMDLPARSLLSTVAACFVLFGLLAVSIEAGRPLRAGYLLMNLHRSWMSRESLAAVVFLASILLWLFFPRPFLIVFGCAAAAAFVIAQALLVFQARAVPGWTSCWIPAVFVSSALAGGSGVLLAVPPLGLGAPEQQLALTVLGCTALDIIIWTAYIHDSRSVSCHRSTSGLRSWRSMLALLGLFRLFPAVLFFFASGNAAMPRFISIAAGGMLFAGTWAQRYAVIRRCGLLRSVELKLSSPM